MFSTTRDATEHSVETKTPPKNSQRSYLHLGLNNSDENMISSSKWFAEEMCFVMLTCWKDTRTHRRSPKGSQKTANHWSYSWKRSPTPKLSHRFKFFFSL